MISRWLGWTVGSLVALMTVLLMAAFFADEPLRRYAERSANGAVEGYSFQIGRLGLHPLTLSVDLGNVVVRQKTHPDPPLVSIPEVVVDARFAPLLDGKTAGNIHLHDPVVFVTQQQIETASAEAARDPSLVFKVGHGKILNSEVGFINRSANLDHRLFLADVNADVDNFSNRLEEAPAALKERHDSDIG